MTNSNVIFEIIYFSSAIRVFEEKVLKELLEQSRRNNQRDGITGMLLYDSGTFIQYIEGPCEPLLACWERIKADPRHRGIIKVAEEPIEARLFADWSMGFFNGEEFGGFHLDWASLNERVPDEFPVVIKTMMRTFYVSARERRFYAKS